MEVRLRRAVVWACVWMLSLGASVTHAAVGRTVGHHSVSASGAAQYSVPLWTPPGIHGVQPALALAYSSREGNGYFGVGWSLQGLSAIRRCANTWAQNGVAREVRNDSGDRFCLNGVQLRLVSGTYGASGAEYRTEIETFARIRSYGVAGTGPAYFLVEQKNGLLYEYGRSEDSRIESRGQSSAQTWALNKIGDRSGNEMLFVYAEDASSGSYRISSIQYTQNSSAGIPPHYEVSFAYEDIPAGEVDAAYVASSKIARVTRAVRIDVRHDGSLLRRYQLTYESTLASTNRSRLASIQECAGAADCYPPSRFTYQNGALGVSAEITTPLSVPQGSNPWPLDVNGDGREDLVYPSSTLSGAGTWIVAFADASGGYSAPLNTGISNANWKGATPIDYNGDGREDLLVPFSGGTWWVLLGTSSGFAAPIDTGAPVTATGVGANARAIDIDGDGLQDLVWADLNGLRGGDAIRYRLRVPGGAFSSTVATLFGPTGSDESLSNVFTSALASTRGRAPDFNGDGRGDIPFQRTIRTLIDGTRSANSVRSYIIFCPGGAPLGFSVDVGSSPMDFGDFNGDGLDDLLYDKGGARPVIAVRYSTGASFTAEVIVSASASYDGFFIVCDWDGDGRDDILRLNRTTLMWDVFRSLGEGFAQPVSTGIPGREYSDVAVMDVNGDGLPDVAYNTRGKWAFRTHSGLQPDLLSSAVDGFGIGASFSYVPITQGRYTKFADAVFPEQDFQGPLYVVSRVEASTGVQSPAAYTQSFWYAGARLNRQGRGFQGFASRRVTDSRNGRVSLQFFARAFPFSGWTTQVDELQPDGVTLIQRSVQASAVKTFGEGVTARYFPYIEASTRDAYEVGGTRNGEWISRETTRIEWDDFGTPKTLSITTQDEDAQSPTVGQVYATRVTRTIENDTASWCLGSAVHTVIENTLPDGASAVRTHSALFDSAACRITQRIVEPASRTLRAITRYGFDACGNLNSVSLIGTNPEGAEMAARTRKVEYGERCQFPVADSNALGEVVKSTWDYALGLRTSLTDEAGVRTTWQHDGFGHTTQDTHADGTYSVWTPELCGESGAACYYRVDQLDYGTDGRILARHSQYFDRLDRSVGASHIDAFGALVERQWVYDALGRLSAARAPFVVASGSKHFTSFEFDLLNRTTRITRERNEADASAQTVNIFYEGLTTRSVDALGRTSTQEHSVLGQLARSLGPSGSGLILQYDAFGNLERVRDTMSRTLQSNVYNNLGMRTSSTDIDMGTWTYAYNSLGEPVSQTDANLQTTRSTYDALSRLLARTEPDGAGTVTYTYAWGPGRLAWAQVVGSSIRSNKQAFAYDAVGRLIRTSYADLEDQITYDVDQSYNPVTGRLETLTYPRTVANDRLTLSYAYQNGELVQIAGAGVTFWQANALDALGNVTDETLGNGLHTTRSHDALTGWLGGITTTAPNGKSIQHLAYAYDLKGNLVERRDVRQNLSERFVYDDEDRLDYSTLNGATNFDAAYDAQGNITSKLGVGSYGYDSEKIHALTAINGESLFAYDANGSARGDSRELTFADFAGGLPKAVNWIAGGYASLFSYGPDRQRFRQEALFPHGRASITYIGGLLEKETAGGRTTWRHYIFTPSGRTALYVRQSGGGAQTHYFTRDHLGSIDSITNAAGDVEVRLSYDAHGWRRNESGWSGAVPQADWRAIYALSHRGFTDHEMLDDLDVIHMNGRIYDPYTGRFTSADPFVASSFDAQAVNRYSYVQNNPLSAIDPSGFLPHVYATNGNETETVVVTAAPLGGGWSAGGAWIGATSRDVANPAAPSVAGHASATVVQSASRPRRAHVEIDCSPGLFICDTGLKKWDGPEEPGLDSLWDDLFFLSFSASRTLGSVGARVLANRAVALGVRDSAGMIANPVPRTLARVTSGNTVRATLGPPTVPDVFVTAAEDIAGLNASQLAQRLSIPLQRQFTVVEFPTPAQGIASPVFRTNPGFIGGGLTGGGAREFVIPNGPLPPGATVRIVGP